MKENLTLLGGLKMTNKKKLYLFRHGETDWNKAGRLQYSIDTELNEIGLKQAEINAENLKNKGIEHIYSSPLKRAYKMGQVLAEKIGVGISVVDELRELRGGEAEGKTREEVYDMIGIENYNKFSRTRNEALDFGLPGGETKKEVRDRAIKAIMGICETSPYSTIGVASHGFTLREFIRATDFEDDSGMSNCEMIEVEFDNGELKILKRVKCENL